jgi:hypothetical protein
MTRSFDEVLEDVFEERAREFSPASRQLLEDLYQQGVLEGRQRERLEGRQQFPLEKAVRSECGNFLCVPVPKHMLVLDGAQAGMDRLERKIRSSAAGSRPASPMSEMLAAMDAEILEKLASQARALEASQNKLVLALSNQLPRAPARQPASANNWETITSTSAAQAIDVPVRWKQEFFGSYASSQSSSMADALRRCVTVTPLDDSSGK